MVTSEKSAFAVVAVEGVVVVGKIGDVKADAAAVIVVADRDAHGACSRPSSFRAKPGKIADVFECAVVFVAVKIFRDRIVGNSEVYPAVVVYIHKKLRRNHSSPWDRRRRLSR
jgi:hypothetical protein